MFVAPPAEEPEVRSLVDAALNGDPRWTRSWSPVPAT